MHTPDSLPALPIAGRRFAASNVETVAAVMRTPDSAPALPIIGRRFVTAAALMLFAAGAFGQPVAAAPADDGAADESAGSAASAVPAALAGVPTSATSASAVGASAVPPSASAGVAASATTVASASATSTAIAAQASASTPQAPIEQSSDWREILPGLTMGSQLRLRSEVRRNARFDDARPGDDEDYLLSRARFDLTWAPNNRVTGTVELQDARILGEEAISETAAPNIFADQLDVHQAYLDIAVPAAGPASLSVRVGRQKLVYGAQRFVSPLEWVNTARVFDGARIGLAAGKGRRLDAFATRLVPVTPTRLNDHGPTRSRMFNSELHGVYYSDAALVGGAALEGFWLLRRAARIDDAVHTIGAGIDARRGRWAFDGEAAAQTGRYGGADHRAVLVHAGGSFTSRGPGGLKIGAAIDVGSGDGDPADGVHGTFDQLYPLGHAYYGYMDLFALQNLRNAEVTAEATLGRARLRVALHDFALLAPGADAWYNVGGAVVHAAADASVSSHVGNELDVTVRFPAGPVGIETGYGRFFGGAYLRDTDFALRTADFFYLQTLVGF